MHLGGHIIPAKTGQSERFCQITAMHKWGMQHRKKITGQFEMNKYAEGEHESKKEKIKTKNK
jgi:hypothetical protein